MEFKTIKLTDFENRLLQVLCENELEEIQEDFNGTDLYAEARITILQNLLLKLMGE